MPQEQEQGQGRFTYKGKPFVGKFAFYRDSDPESMRPQLKRAARARMFDMSDARQIEAYEEIVSSIVNRDLEPGFEEINWHPEKGTYVILLRWYEPYYTNPDSGQDIK